MFEKLLAVLPYNPSLVQQVGFYARRMRQEQHVRRTGMIFLVLAFFVQFFAVFSPPQPTVAYSTNDMINGGIRSKTEAVTRCQDNTKSYGDVLNDFGISCSDVARATEVASLSSTAYGRNLYSMGWIPYGQVNPDTHKPTGQVPLNLVKVPSTLYARHLWSFDTYDHSNYRALMVTSHATHRQYFILYSCGNLVSIGAPAPLPRCQYNQAILKADDKCFKPCTYNASIPAGSAQCFKPCPLPGKGMLPVSSPLCKSPGPKPPASTPPAATTPAPCIYNSSLTSDDQNCKPCEQSVSSQDMLACVVVNKTAANTTQNLSDADNTTAQGGDVIVYTLHAKNQGKTTVNGFVFQDNISDVLDYATVTDLHGGSINDSGDVSWPAVNIEAGATATVSVTVTVKNPIPETPVAPSDGGHFDLIMTNTYGESTININLPASPAKTVETTAATLPNTGPGSSLLVAGMVVVLGGYFYARARLLNHEAVIAMHDSVSGGL